MSDLHDWYLGGMVVAADKAEFKEDEHPRGKGGMFVKKGEGGGSDGVAGKVAAYRKKHEAFSKELLKDLNSPVAEKMRGELQSMLSELDGMGVDVERLGVGKDDKIPMKSDKAEFKKGEGGGSSSALEEVYKKGGFKHPDALAKADLEELGKMSDSRLDAEITMLKGKVEEGGKPLDKARLEAAEGIMKGRGEKKADTNGKIEGNGEESLKKAISELSDDRLDIAIKNGERNAKREDLSEEQRKRYERTLPYLKAEKAKRGGQKVIKTKEEYSKALEGFIKMEDWGDDISGISSVNKLKKIGDAPNYIVFAGKNGSEALKNRLEKLGLGVKETPNGNMQVFMK